MTSLIQAISCQSDYDPNALPVSRAQELILSMLEPVGGIERVFVRQALGRVLAQDAISPINVPASDNSAMDGYAVRHEDLSADAPTQLKVVGTVLAGHPFDRELKAGEALRIMTGAVVCASMDTVVIQEVTTVDGDTVTIPPGQKKGQNIRRAGEDLRKDHAAIVAGKLLRPAELGLLASIGAAEVSVYRKVRVALFSTGDELRSLGTPLEGGEVYDSNRYTMWGVLTRLGCEVIDMGVVPDNPQALEAALKSASENADIILTSGGVSVGEADFIREMMARLGEVLFWKIAMKPGRPMAFGKIGNAWLFGLPGNPVAVMITFYQFVRQAILKLAGQSPVLPVPTFSVPTTVALKKNAGRTEFLRAKLSNGPNGLEVSPAGAQGSGVLRSMSEANCLVILEHERGNIAAGEIVQVQAMDGLV
ncbi:MAG TPA: gephyrin-like molybdotransferase Glp [Rhodocyclaceae bacterium]|nr:gephyrin-like molybdotransferase Glp [Rhodocyclaceae bacterium]